jgi:Uma2 family endonuclease
MGVIADVRMRPLTVEDYERIVDAGILGEDDRVELLKGQLAEMSPQGEQHAGCSSGS